MSESLPQERHEPTRAEVESWPGSVLLEFGAGWCPHCQAIQPELAAVKARYPHVRHVVIEDGAGRPLGRSFRVKLWPTLVFLLDGKVVGQIVRPSAEEIANGFTDLESARAAGVSAG